jgi:hypothetical protein
VVTEVVSYLSDVNFFEGVLVFVGIPLIVVLVVALLTVVPNRAKLRPKYTPGSGWDYSDRFYTGDSPVEVPSHLTDSRLGGARGTW